ncbi:MAG: LacI family DNA-binding transcriptional regulator [Clostridia bacterium]|nr:LacI family DNA-binding transcriptional regulator [Clostridia bacterium]
MSITIKDVAKKANVSISTVSRVINDSKPVSDDIKMRVVKVIEELGYKPNPVARSLVTKKSRLIGVIIPDISDPYIAELLNAIEEVAKTYDYDIILCNSYGSLESEEHYLNLLRTKQVEGMIFLTYKLRTAHKDFFESTKMPVVMVNRDASELNLSSVSVNHFDAVYEITNKLFEDGHERIALIRNGKTSDVFGPSHLKGFEKAHETHHKYFDESMVFNGAFKLERAYDIVKQLIEMKELPTAIVATTDSMAIGAINCLVDHGYKVPEDVSVSGFYDTKIAQLYRPQLTTIKQPIYDIGAIAIRLLIKQINGDEKDKKHFYLPHELILRDSTRSLK